VKTRLPTGSFLGRHREAHPAKRGAGYGTHRLDSRSKRIMKAAPPARCRSVCGKFSDNATVYSRTEPDGRYLGLYSRPAL